MVNRASIVTIRALIKRFLESPLIIKYAKKTLHNFPRLDEYIRVWHYRIRKRLQAGMSGRVALQMRTAEGLSFFMFDVSHLIRRDVHTGVQRVVRSLFMEFLKRPPVGYEIVPVYVNDHGQLMRSLTFGAKSLGETVRPEGDLPVLVRDRDIWFTADTYLQYPKRVLHELGKHGVRIVFTVYDLLPLRYPQYFYKAQKLEFLDWFRTVLKYADDIVCISRVVADDLRNWRAEHPLTCSRPLSISHFHLGADIGASKPTYGMSEDDSRRLDRLRGRPTLLMVGTLEPRKGHTSIIQALDLLWSTGEEINLVVVGKEGWRAHDIVIRIERHPELNRRLFWFNRASDELLQQIYVSSTALMAASFSEGFGLPLIEAARHGVPIIARDIPVFREVAGQHAYYFRGDSPEEIAASLKEWLGLWANGRHPLAEGMPFLTWCESAQQVMEILFREHKNL